MSHVKSFKELVVWQKSTDLVTAIYALTEKFPLSEERGLISQMRRAAVSIPSNIAEGSSASSRNHYRHYLSQAFGSGAELETQLIIIKKLPLGKYLKDSKADALLNEVMRMLNVMIRKLSTSNDLKHN